MNKNAFSLIELIFALTLISFTIIFFNFNSLSFIKPNKLDLVTNKLVLYLKQLRYQGLIDDKYDLMTPLWYKRRWTLAFFNCRRTIGGIYYSIFSDENMMGHPNKQESLKDPLTNKYIYTNNNCSVEPDTSKYVLLTKEFGIKQVKVSCKMDLSLGKISFGGDGKIYKKLSSNENEAFMYQIEKPCDIELINFKGEKRVIRIEPYGGNIHKI